NDKTVRLLEISSGRSLIVKTSGPVYSMAFSPDGLLFAIADGPQVQLFDIDGNPTHHVLQSTSGRIEDLSFAPWGNLIATAGEDKTVRLWNLDGKQIGIPF